MKRHAGFTLLEILVVVGVIGVLAAGVVFVLNPSRQFAQARNEKRTTHVEVLAKAVAERIAGNRNVWNSACGAVVVKLPSTETGIGSGPGNVNLGACLVPSPMPAMVLDPLDGTSASTGYSIFRDAHGAVTVSAPHAEGDQVISVTK